MTSSLVQPRTPEPGNTSDREAGSFAALLVALVLAFSQDGVYGLFFLSYMNHYLLDVLKASPGMPGYALALFGATKLLVTPVSGRFLDRTSPRRLLLIASALQVAGVISLLVWHALAGFFVAAALLAAGSAAMWPMIYEVVAHSQSPAMRARASALLAITGYVALGTGLAAGLLLSRLPAHRLPILFALALVVLPLAAQGNKALDRRRRPLTTPATDEADPGDSGRNAAFILFALVLFLDIAAVTSLAGLYGPYARRTLHIGLLHTAILLIPAGLTSLAALFAAARLSRRDRRLGEMAVLYVLSAIGAVGLATTATPWAAALWAIPLAAGVGAVTPVITAAMIDGAHHANRGLIFGTLMSVEGLGAVAGPGLTAIASDLLGPRAGFVLVAGAFAGLVPLSFAASRRWLPQSAAAAT